MLGGLAPNWRGFWAEWHHIKAHVGWTDNIKRCFETTFGFST
jgi:hypothetical protein